MRGWVLLGLLLFSLAWADATNLALTALSYLERQYKFGSNELKAMDCSAFVQRVFAVHGIALPRTTKEQAKVGYEVSPTELQPGDLLFFSTYRKGPSHVGIYVGNGKMVHASEKEGITISSIHEPYWRHRFLFARRVAPLGKQAKASKQERDEIRELILTLKAR